MAEVVVSMKKIQKSFPGVHALDDAQIELKKGEVHGLIGENGAGKSTLMKVLTGCLLYTSLSERIQNKNFDALQVMGEIVYPKVSEEDLKENTVLIGSCETLSLIHISSAY